MPRRSPDYKRPTQKRQISEKFQNTPERFQDLGSPVVRRGCAAPDPGQGTIRVHATVGNTGAVDAGAADPGCQACATPGLRGAYQFVVGQGGLATFSGGIGWRRGFGEAPTAQLGSNGGSPFVIAAIPAAADPLEPETRLDFDLAEGLEVSARHAGSLTAWARLRVLRAGPGRPFRG